MTHVDADHIAGAIPMVREADAPFTPRRVWYDSRPQLVAARDRRPIHEPFGARQGEKLARGIVKFNWPWNAEFASEIVSTDSAEAMAPIAVNGGLTIRLLSPNDRALEGMLDAWDAELAGAHIRTFDPDIDESPVAGYFEPLGLAPDVEALAAEPFVGDQTPSNAASIAFLLQLLDCTRFAFSTNGDRHRHPDPQTIARILVNDPRRLKTLYFNYRKPMAEQWDSPRLKDEWCCATAFPETGASDGTLTIDLS